jgi:hypothetical protein
MTPSGFFLPVANGTVPTGGDPTLGSASGGVGFQKMPWGRRRVSTENRFPPALEPCLLAPTAVATPWCSRRLADDVLGIPFPN